MTDDEFLVTAEGSNGNKIKDNDAYMGDLQVLHERNVCFLRLLKIHKIF